MKILVTYSDLLANTNQFYVCNADIFENGHIVYKYNGAMYKIDVNLHEVLIKLENRDGFTRLYANNGKGEAIVSNDIGKMILDLVIVDSSVSAHRVAIEYKLMMNRDVVSHFRYIWEGSV